MAVPHAEPLRLGILGVTHPHLSARVRAFREQGAVFVTAWDAGPELTSFCRALTVDSADSPGSILADPGIDAVLVHSKSERMVEHSIDALRAGKHVLVEKPGGTGVEDLTRLVEAERQSNARCQVGYNFRFSEALAQARQCLADGVLGRVTHIRAHGASSSGEHLTSHLNQPRDLGGALWVIGCHVVELLVALLGTPVAVSGLVRKFGDWSPAMTREDGAAAALDYGRLLASFDFTVNDSQEWFESSEVTVYGEYGQLTFGILPAYWRLFLTEPRAGRPAGWTSWRDTYFTQSWTGEAAEFTELPQVGNRSFFDNEAAAFTRYVRTGAGEVPTPSDALDVARIIAAIYASSTADGLLQHVAR